MPHRRIRKNLLPPDALPRVSATTPKADIAFLNRMTRGVEHSPLYRQYPYKAYLITNLKTDERYVGRTIQPIKDRWRAHLWSARKGRQGYLYDAIRKYGLDNFLFEFVACAIDKKVFYSSEFEGQLIEQYDTVQRGYNQTSGGSAGEKKGIATKYGDQEYISLNALARANDQTPSNVYQRVKKYGFTLEEALHPDKHPRRVPRRKPYFLHGKEYPNFSEACRQHGLDESAVRSRLKVGRTQLQAFGLEKWQIVLRNGQEIGTVCEGRHYRTVKDLALAYGKLPATVLQRLHQHFSPEQAVGLEPPPVKARPGRNITLSGISYCSVAEACRQLGKQVKLVSGRLARGWSVEEAFDGCRSRPPSPNGEAITVQGILFPSLKAAAKHFSIPYKQVHKRLKALNWTIERAFGLVNRAESPGNHRTPITIMEVRYESKKAACRSWKIGYETVCYRASHGMSWEEAITTPVRPKRKAKGVGKRGSASR